MINRNKRLTVILAAVSIVIALFFSMSCASQENEPTPSLQIVNHKMTVTAASGGRQSSAVVNGRAQNTGERSIVSATITADFFDENGKFIHSGSTTYGNLAPGEIWEFAVEITNADAWKITKYTVKTNVSQ